MAATSAPSWPNVWALYRDHAPVFARVAARLRRNGWDLPHDVELELVHEFLLRKAPVVLEAFDPGLVLELFATYRGNAMVGVPTMLVAMLEHPSFASTDLSSVKAICSGGPCTGATITEWSCTAADGTTIPAKFLPPACR